MARTSASPSYSFRPGHSSAAGSAPCPAASAASDCTCRRRLPRSTASKLQAAFGQVLAQRMALRVPSGLSWS
jgi:hypothetical protein